MKPLSMISQPIRDTVSNICPVLKAFDLTTLLVYTFHSNEFGYRKQLATLAAMTASLDLPVH